MSPADDVTPDADPNRQAAERPAAAHSARRTVLGLGAAAVAGSALLGSRQPTTTRGLSATDLADESAARSVISRAGAAGVQAGKRAGASAPTAPARVTLTAPEAGKRPAAAAPRPRPANSTARSAARSTARSVGPRNPRRTAAVDTGVAADRDQSYALVDARGRHIAVDAQRLLPSYSSAARAAGLLSTSPSRSTVANPRSPLSHPVFFSGVTPGMPGIADAERHALRRLTFGPSAADRAAVAHLGLDRWIAQQLNPATLPDTAQQQAEANFAMLTMNSATIMNLGDNQWQAPYQVAWATLQRQMFSSRQLYEVVVDVFANLQNIGMPTSEVNETAPDWNRNVIRKYAFGRYEDMLLAAARHPAMMQFLNNDQSNKANINENYGRELLELHTVGVASGYTEHDVRNSAYILSGRSRNWQDGTFVYNADDHWTGPVSVLGFSDPNPTGAGGLAVGDAYLRYLAQHPATAHTVARKLAVRFVSDNPPDSLVNRMTHAYLDNNSAIVPVLDVMLRSTEFWAAVGQKTRRPAEDIVGSVRALGTTTCTAQSVQDLYWYVQSTGNAPLGWAPPNGYPDVAVAWRSAIGLVQRWNAHRALAAGWWSTKPGSDAIAGLSASTSMTWAAYLDRIAIATVGQTLTSAHRGAIVSFLGVNAGDKVDANQSWKAPYLIALVLDSPYFQLR